MPFFLGTFAMTLSPRQREVACLASDGLTNKQIARELGLSPATVKLHLAAACVKLGINRRAAIGKALSERSTLDVQETAAQDPPRACCRCC